jgi:hypothetical protein
MNMAEPTAPRTLADLAHAYTRGELEGWEVEGFEDRLAVDQEARDALVVAVQDQAGADAGTLRPDPAYRQEVIRRLTPAPWWSWLGRVAEGVRTRAGWLGATAALVLLLVGGAWLLPTAASPQPEPAPLVHVPAPALRAPLDTPDSEATARFWADLPRSDHLARAVEEEMARKLRSDMVRPGRPEATASLRPDGPMMP